MSLPVRLEELRDIGHQRVIGIGVGQEAANAQQDFGNGESGRPLVLQNVQADPAVRVDVAVVNASRKVDLGRLERVISRKVNVQKEDSTGIRRFVRSHNGRLPVEHVVTDGSGTAVGRRVFTEVDQFWARRGGRAGVGVRTRDGRGRQTKRHGRRPEGHQRKLTFVDSFERHGAVVVVVVVVVAGRVAQGGTVLCSTVTKQGKRTEA